MKNGHGKDYDLYHLRTNPDDEKLSLFLLINNPHSPPQTGNFLTFIL